MSEALTPKAAPCPFCGEMLTPTLSHLKDSIVGYAHRSYRNGSTCRMAGHHIGAARVDYWNRRAPTGAAVYMTVVDDHPVFNTKGAGQKVSIEMVNATIAWYRRKADEGIEAQAVRTDPEDS